MEEKKSAPEIYGLLAEFADPDALLEAARRAREAGFRALDAYSPFPIHGLDEAVGMRRTNLPFLSLACGLIGACGGFLLQYWVSAIAYPLNVGGRPFFSWPSFIPITFESGVLLASFGTAIGMLIANGLPQPYHPLFNVEEFARASQDGFFLCIESADPQFDPEKTRQFLQGLNPREVFRVDP